MSGAADGGAPAAYSGDGNVEGATAGGAYLCSNFDPLANPRTVGSLDSASRTPFRSASDVRFFLKTAVRFSSNFGRFSARPGWFGSIFKNTDLSKLLSIGDWFQLASWSFFGRIATLSARAAYPLLVSVINCRSSGSRSGSAVILSLN